jgi:hypothetical protein
MIAAKIQNVTLIIITKNGNCKKARHRLDQSKETLPQIANMDWSRLLLSGKLTNLTRLMPIKSRNLFVVDWSETNVENEVNGNKSFFFLSMQGLRILFAWFDCL